MIAKDFAMFYFDDKTFIGLCKQLEKELRAMTAYSEEHAHDLRLAYQKFELFLSVYYHSRKREDIDYKLEQRLEIATDLSHTDDLDQIYGVTEDYHSENFFNAKEKLERIMEDLIYQITMRNLSANTQVHESD